MYEALKKILSPEQIIFDDKELKAYGQDWTKLFDPKASVLLFPKTTLDVQNIVLWANEHKVALVPSGGRTGLSGGAVALNNEALVSFEKMNKILSFNEDDLTISCESGAITKDIQNLALDKGYFFPVEFSATGSSQIGGNIATNAGGINVIRYGMFRNWVTSLEVVTGTGEILHLNKGLEKNNTGYDLKNLFIGSEGTLGFITKATLKLTKPPKDPQVFLLACEGPDHILPILKAFRSLTLNAFEVFSDLGLSYVMKHSHLPAPFQERHPVYVVVDFEAAGDSQDLALQIFENLLSEGLILDGVLSQNQTQYKELWGYREHISESISAEQPYKNDVSVRTSKIPEFIKASESYMAQEFPNSEVVWFGHIGDGNLHINILKPKDMNKEDFKKMCAAKSPTLFSQIQKFEGSISAEHGVGLIKKDYLQYSRSAEEIQLLKQIKKIFDPNLLLNPGKMI